MTAYDLMLRRNKVSQQISYIDNRIKENCDNKNIVYISKEAIEDIKSDLYGYIVLIDEDLKKVEI